ncbi:plasma-membrane proton-efflux P-type ATPase [Persephonella sp.]|uniref:plasma-membrane proton-efflux P-type ATPase n=1 Tax=Persephonella sp. TaxID=2060922 RepID=UPI0025E5BBA3|nr:plasma-membrane proton-efflux P-type ATPase [Persephonella sp.]
MAVIDEVKDKPVEEVIKEFQTDLKKGLSEEEVKERLKKYGLNEIPEKEEPLWHRIFRRFWGPIPWMIEIAAILSASVQKWEDFTIIMILLFVNAGVDLWQEHKALSALKVLKEKLAKKSIVLRDGKWKEIDARYIVPGDIIKLKIGDIIPADVKLVEGDFILVDQSALTGESLPVTKKAGDVAYANSIVKQGEMIVIVVATGLNTYFGKTVKLVAKAEREERSHFQEMVIKVGNFLIIITLILVGFMILFELNRGANWVELLRFSLVLTVAAIPVALPAVLTVTMAVGALYLAKRQVIVSRLASIEELAGVDILCSDKTGTLTKNQMTVSVPFTVDGYKSEDLMFYAALASKEENKDPIEIPIFDWLKKHNLYEKVKQCSQKKFIPFDPVRKRTEALAECSGEKIIVTKGAPQVIIELCNPSEFDKNVAYQRVEEFAENGFRTLGVAFKKPEEEEFHFVGLIPLFDPPREDSKPAIEEAKKYGVEVKMITGDNIAVAKYIAKLLGIGDKIYSAKELRGETYEEYVILAQIITKALLQVEEGLSPEKAENKAKKIAKLVEKELEGAKLPSGTVKRHESEIIRIIEEANGFAEVFPEDKYFIVDKLQKADHIVGMTGDGVNDAPALRKADCGIAVSNATDAARAAAALVLLAPGLMVIVRAIEIAREIFGRMESYTIYRIAETIRVVFFMALSIMIFQFYPITALMIIILALLNDIPILSIAYDNSKISPKPVRWDMYEINIMAFWLGVAGVISSFTLFFLLVEYWKLPEDLIQSIIFTKLVVAGHGTIYNTRVKDWFWKKPWPSPILYMATFGTRILGTIIAVYGGWGLFTPVGWEWAIFIWGYAIAWFLFNDVVKMAILKMYWEKKFFFAPGHFTWLKKEMGEKIHTK